MDYVPFGELRDCDLRVGVTYEAGGGSNHFANEPIKSMLPVGVAGGIRFKGSINRRNSPRCIRPVHTPTGLT